MLSKYKLNQLYFKDTQFANLMTRRIFNVLLIANPYDAFMLEDDGRIDEKIFNEYTSLNLPSISVRQNECTVPRNMLFPLTKPNSFSLSVNSLAASLLYVKHAKPRGSAITPFNKCMAFKVNTVVFPLPGPANTTVLL